MLSMGNAQKIADYLDVSVDFLMGRERPDPADGWYVDGETAEIAQSIFDDQDLRILFDAAPGQPSRISGGRCRDAQEIEGDEP